MTLEEILNSDAPLSFNMLVALDEWYWASVYEQDFYLQELRARINKRQDIERMRSCRQQLK